MKQLKLVSASWCGPCQMLKKQIEEQNLKVDIVDADSNLEFVKEHSIKSVPTLVVLEDNQLLLIVKGADQILSVIKENQQA